jgi:acetyl esterase/lipase
MIFKKVDLYEYYKKPKKQGYKGILSVYLHDESPEWEGEGRFRPALLVLPGGAYAYCSDREAEPVALTFLAKSFNAFVLDYTCAPTASYPTQLLEASMAMAYIRENAKEFHILEDKVAVMGFSAGGHLACSVSTLYAENVVKEYLKEKAKFVRPDLMVLGYPVILTNELTHLETKDNISNFDEKVAEFLSLEKHVDKNCPPAFIWTTTNDDDVPSENTLEIACAYKRAGVSFELHMFEKGLHGLSLSNIETSGDINPQCNNKAVNKWLELIDTFFKANGFTPPNRY